jgi:hypothetical protein
MENFLFGGENVESGKAKAGAVGENIEKGEVAEIGSVEFRKCFFHGQRPEVGPLFCEVENSEGGDGLARGVPRNGGGWSGDVATGIGNELPVRKNR